MYYEGRTAFGRVGGRRSLNTKKNGFITFYILWIGTVCICMALAAASLAACFLKSSRQYMEAIQLTYLSESALHISWSELQERRWQDVPTNDSWDFVDTYGLAEPRQKIKIYCKSGIHQIPFQGYIRAVGRGETTLTERSCALRFEVRQASTGDKTKFIIKKIIY